MLPWHGQGCRGHGCPPWTPTHVPETKQSALPRPGKGCVPGSCPLPGPLPPGHRRDGDKVQRGQGGTRGSRRPREREAEGWQLLSGEAFRSLCAGRAAAPSPAPQKQGHGAGLALLTAGARWGAAAAPGEAEGRPAASCLRPLLARPAPRPRLAAGRGLRPQTHPARAGAGSSSDREAESRGLPPGRCQSTRRGPQPPRRRDPSPGRGDLAPPCPAPRRVLPPPGIAQPPPRGHGAARPARGRAAYLGSRSRRVPSRPSAPHLGRERRRRTRGPLPPARPRPPRPSPGPPRPGRSAPTAARPSPGPRPA